MTLPAGDRVLAFHTDVDLPAFRAARTWSGFQELARATMLVRSALDGLDAKAPHAIAVTAAHSAELERAIGPGWVAIGDASAAFDPLSSQGLTHALFTAVTAGEALQSLLDGEAHPLVRYAEANADIYSRYRVALRETYRMETRWRERPFWARRS